MFVMEKQENYLLDTTSYLELMSMFTKGVQKLIIYRIWPNYHIVHLGFSKLLGKLVVKYDSAY